MVLDICLIQRTACIWVTNYAHINRRIMFVFKGPRTDAERGGTAPGVRPCARSRAVLETSSNWTIAKVFSKKSIGLSIWKKATRMFWKLLNILLKSHLCVRDAGADGSGWWILCGPLQINKRMGNTGGCLRECRQFSSPQNEPYKTSRARGDFAIVNRSRVVSLSRVDNKCKR